MERIGNSCFERTFVSASSLSSKYPGMSRTFISCRCDFYTVRAFGLIGIGVFLSKQPNFEYLSGVRDKYSP